MSLQSLVTLCFVLLSGSYAQNAQVIFTTTRPLAGRFVGSTCTVTNLQPSQSIASISWGHNGTMIVNGERITITNEFASNRSHLNINNLVPSDSGEYTCSVQLLHPASQVTDIATLEIQSVPTVTANPEQVALEGETAIIRCNVTSMLDANISWYRGPEGSEVVLGLQLSTDTNFGMWMIPNVQGSNAGRYQCVVENSVGTASAVIQLEVLNASPPRVVISPRNTTVEAGSTTVLSCMGFGDPMPYVTWTREATELNNGSRTTIYERLVTSDGMMFVQSILQICSVGETDNGQYSCTVGNAVGNASIDFELSVTAAVPPRIVISPRNSTVEAGSTTVLSCVGFGDPIPYVTWTRGATELSNGSRTTIYERLVTSNGVMFVESILQICSVGETDNGQYSCTVGNAVGNASVDFELSVTAAATPRVVISPRNSTVEAGSTTVLSCVGFGDLIPYVTWTRGATELSNGSRTTIYERLVTSNGVMFVQSILQICSVGETDNGQYSCTVGNAVGNASVDFELSVTEETIFCEAETTEFLSWPNTPADTTHSLCCPNTTTVINRTCSSSGVWESVDPSLCTPFTSINVDTIDLGNYEEVLTDVSGAVRGAATNEQQQTTGNLAMVTAALARSAALVNETTIISNTTVQDLVNTLEGLQQWNESVLQTNSSNIVRSFEVIVSIFAQQLEDGERFSSMTETILFVAELLSQMELAENGRSFSSSGLTNNTNIDIPNENETAAAFLPPFLFQSITDRNSTGIFFTVYDTGVFFPIRNATELDEGTNTSVTTVVGSPVLAATVGRGLNFSGLVDPVVISLRLNDLGNVTREPPQCVSWDFDSQEWTTEGCVTADMNGDMVTCNCNHLTNFAILVDICSRFQESCRPPPVLRNVLETVTIIGVVLSLAGIVATVFTLLFFKKLRERNVTIFHIQLCIALFCMLIVFVCGINQTNVYGGCVAVSVLIHYFTLVSVMWMGAEAVLMFRKLVIVFSQITTKFFVTVSLICWLVPIIPVVIPLAVDLSDVVSENDLVVHRPTEESGQVIRPGFCFIDDIGVFFGAFLGPIFAILIGNTVIFVMVIRVLIKHTQNTLDRTKEQLDKKTVIRLLISIAGVMFLFGLTWLFGALTVTGFGSATASTAFQVLFVILNAFQGFFIFLFFCVLSKDARDAWLNLVSCGRHLSKSSKSSHPSNAKYAKSGANAKVKTTSTGVTDSMLSYSKGGYNSNTDDLVKERYIDIPLTSAAEQEKEKPSLVICNKIPSVATFKDDPEIQETNFDPDKKVDLGSSEVKENEQELEKSNNSEED